MKSTIHQFCRYPTSMIVHCETCKIDLLETESDRVALNTKDCHEFEHLHSVSRYLEDRGQRVRLARIVGPFTVISRRGFVADALAGPSEHMCNNRCREIPHYGFSRLTHQSCLHSEQCRFFESPTLR